ncbi:MAG: LysR family transcriptional regulator [Gammaproteobacteria bacterium]
MKFDHIRTFLEIAAGGSFGRAAERLNVTQSTISGRVKLLEQQFGRPLFTRSHAGVELTSAGRRFRRYAEGIERMWQQARQQVTLPEGYHSALALGAQVSLWERLILDWMPRMRRLAPAVALQVQADYSNSLMTQLSDGLLDIGVMYQPRQVAGLVIEDLFEETLVMAAREPRDVFGGWVEEYVFVDWGDSFRAEHGAAFPDLDTPAVSVGLGALGLQYILQNGGSGYFPLRMVEPLVKQGRLHRVGGAPSVRRPAYMVYTANPKDEEVLQLALNALRDIARRVDG